MSCGCYRLELKLYFLSEELRVKNPIVLLILFSGSGN